MSGDISRNPMPVSNSNALILKSSRLYSELMKYAEMRALCLNLSTAAVIKRKQSILNEHMPIYGAKRCNMHVGGLFRRK